MKVQILARTYDNGDISKAHKDRYLALLGERIRGGVASQSPEPRLEKIMADFYGAVSARRDKDEAANQAVAVAPGQFMHADESGMPKEYAGALSTVIPALTSFGKMVWHNFFDREAQQNAAAEKIADHIDRKLTALGADMTEINTKAEYHTAISRVHEAAERFDEALKSISLHSAAKDFTAPGTSQRMGAIGLGGLAALKAEGYAAQFDDAVRALPAGRLEAFATSEFAKLKEALSPGGHESDKRDEVSQLRDDVRGFHDKLSSWDVMEAYQAIWNDRAAICAAHGMHEEAEAAKQVAAEYDRTHFEPMQKAWDAEWARGQKEFESAGRKVDSAHP